MYAGCAMFAGCALYGPYARYAYFAYYAFDACASCYDDDNFDKRHGDHATHGSHEHHARHGVGHPAMEAALRFQTATGGGLYGAVWLRSAGLFRARLRRRCELNHVLEFLRLVELQRQRRDRCTASVGGMDRP